MDFHPNSPQRRRPIVGDPEAAKTKTRRGRGTQIMGMGEIVKNDKGL